MFTHARFLFVMIVAAIVLTFMFWWPLYGGGGFIGGDLYPYFFPQKVFYADHLKRGEFPLWNDLSGFGYPVIGESQTGVAYPFHLVFYRFLDLNTAYNVEHLLHYVICFVATALFAKRLGLTSTGAGLTALVFTYGWFPPRACLEWAILNGAWLPAALWCVESFVQTRWWRYAIGLSVVLAIQILAGHFHLAFITQLLVVTYAGARLWIEQRERRSGTCAKDGPCGRKAAVGLVLAGLAAIGLASIQLLPTWELKQRSSRVVKSEDYDPAYGHMPPIYASQLIAPWLWYSPQAIDEDNLVREIAEFTAPWHWFGPDKDLDESLHRLPTPGLTAGTNKVEAHVYCGLVPILMAAAAVVMWFRKRQIHPASARPVSVMDSMMIYWLVAATFALVYATGCLLPIGRHLPGFSFFRGPGRYGIVTTLAIALLAGQLLSQLSPRFPSALTQFLIAALVFGSTCGDLWLVSRMVKYTFIVRHPAISFREQCEVRRVLLAESAMPRLLAPGPNVGNLMGVSCVPWYLGIAPEEYVDPQFAMPDIPKPMPNGQPTPCPPGLLEWLSRSGVTHVLNFEPLEESSWQVDLLWSGVDPFLNRVWGRAEPIYLYRFRKSPKLGESVSFPGRAYLTDGSDRIPPLDWQNARSGSRRVVVESGTGGDTTLILTEVAYPGWTVQRNGAPWEASQSGMFRAVKCPTDGGEFVWTYRPFSVFCGAGISLVTLIVLAAVAHVRYWHPELTRAKGKNVS